MAVTTTYTPITVNWTTTNQAIPITWPFFTGSLVVTEVSSTGVETVKTLTTHYTVSGGTDSNGLPATGTVTMVGAATSGSQIRVTRSTPKLQTTVFVENDPFPAKVIEAAFDGGVLIAQEAVASGSNGITGDVLQLNTAGATDYWDGESKVARGFANGTEATDLVTFGQTVGFLNDAEAAADAAAASATAAAASAAAAAADEVAVQALYNATVANYVQPSSTVAYEHLLLDDIGASFNGATATFSLLNGGAAFTPASAAQLIVHVGGVYQKPGTDYTVSTSQITFTTAPDTGLGCTILAQKTASGVVDIVPTSYWNTVLTTAGTAAASRIQLGTRTSALDNIAASFNGVTTTFNLTVSSSAFTPRDVYGVQCIYNGAPQIPGDAFTVSGSQITFTFTPQSGDTCALWAVNA